MTTVSRADDERQSVERRIGELRGFK